MEKSHEEELSMNKNSEFLLIELTASWACPFLLGTKGCPALLGCFCMWKCRESRMVRARLLLVSSHVSTKTADLA